MGHSSQNSKCSSMGRLTGRWCTSPCSRFTPAASEPQISTTLANQISSFRRALTAPQVAEILSVSVVSIFRLAKRGVIPAFRVGTSLRFCPAAIAQWLRERGG